MPTLDWIGKAAVVNHDQSVPTRLLHCDAALSVGPPDSPNLLVEGDNLGALKALLPFYAKGVKCIYIDPPYNTGNEGWIYNDNVRAPEIVRWLGEVVGKEAEDLSRHDKWLCMMYPRLKLLKAFLRDDGAIFISIDDNEVAHLRLLLDEIFGARNFVANVVWQKNFSPKNSARHLSENHDHVLLYAKNADLWLPYLLTRSDEQGARYKNPDSDPRGVWTSGDCSARNFYSLGTYPITAPSGRVIAGPPKGTFWRFSKPNFDQLDADKRIWWGVGGNNTPRLKRFLSEVKEGVTPQTIWFHTEAGNTQEAKKELLAILPDAEKVFISPKPTRLIQRILEIATQEGDLVLDSFMGSGTTGHAAMMLKRRFIGVEMESQIARPVTYQRLKRVIEGYGDKPALGGGFRFCTLGEPLFDATGQIRAGVGFWDIAHHLFFSETGRPLPARLEPQTSFIGACENISYHLLTDAPLDNAALKTLPPGGVKVVYAPSCRVSAGKLERRSVVYKQLPCEVKTR